MDFDRVITRGKRDSSEIGGDTDQRCLFAVDPRYKAREVSDFDQRVAGPLDVDGRAIVLADLGFRQDSPAR